MSPNGMQPLKEPLRGSHAVLKPWPLSAPSICSAWATHVTSPTPSNAPAIEGFKPLGRKKFIKDELTHGPAGPLPQWVFPPPTVNGLPTVCPSPSALRKLLTIRSPRTVLALIGRFKWRPPLKLYARLSA